MRRPYEWKGVTIVEAECCPNYIHMLLEIQPKMGVLGFIEYLKGKSSLMLCERFRDLKFKYRITDLGTGAITWTRQAK